MLGSSKIFTYLTQQLDLNTGVLEPFTRDRSNGHLITTNSSQILPSTQNHRLEWTRIKNTLALPLRRWCPGSGRLAPWPSSRCPSWLPPARITRPSNQSAQQPVRYKFVTVTWEIKKNAEDRTAPASGSSHRRRWRRCRRAAWRRRWCNSGQDTVGIRAGSKHI